VSAGATDNAGAAHGADATGAARYCGQCGKPLADAAVHGRCAARAELEPPRYCASCARRMVVQVVPGGWTARCSEHGLRSSPKASAH
jgi:hypothetical protein